MRKWVRKKDRQRRRQRKRKVEETDRCLYEEIEKERGQRKL